MRQNAGLRISVRSFPGWLVGDYLGFAEIAQGEEWQMLLVCIRLDSSGVNCSALTGFWRIWSRGMDALAREILRFAQDDAKKEVATSWQ